VSLPIAIVLVLLVALVVWVVSAPLRAAAAGSADVSSEAERAVSVEAEQQRDALRERQDLEAAREAKYREIRDAEMDFRTGKLSAEDYEATDAALRAEALEILNSLQRYGEGGSDGDGEER
jgi:biopolymer transport protein ExbB/TolQ